MAGHGPDCLPSPLLPWQLNGGSLACRLPHTAQARGPTSRSCLPPPPSRRPAAASSLDPNCPYSALYIVATLPKIKTVTAWNAVKPIYIAAWQRLLPAGACTS